MSGINKDWIFNDVSIRRWVVRGMVSVSDIWKASGGRSSLRPDKWLKSDLIQTRLEKLALTVIEGVERDKNNKLIKVPGVVEIVRGGRYSQGTFASYDLAIDYTKLLSNEIHKWFTSSLQSGMKEESSVALIPTYFEDFGDDVRFTPDGRISVYDGIAYTTGHKNPRQVWNELSARLPEVVQKTDNFQFPGRGQRETPVATLQVFLEILITLPGRIAAEVREKAVRTLIRVMNGDPSLVDEIISRMKDPQDLREVEESVKLRREKAYGGIIPSGTLSNPLKEITPEIRQGYGWRNKTEEMTRLLADLATHVADMVVGRESPHRAYGAEGKVKSRIIPLTLRTLANLQTLHIYSFESSFIDDGDVIEVFQKRAYPEIAYRDYASKGVKRIVAYLVAPAGITTAGVERLSEIQKTLDSKYRGSIVLDAMRLDELVWGIMYPAIEERYSDGSGTFGKHHLNRTVKNLCKKLCQQTNFNKSLPSANPEYRQLSLFGELLSPNN